MLQQIILVGTLTFTLTLACSTPLSDAEFADMYCDSTMVMSGSITGGDSNYHNSGPYDSVFSKSYVDVLNIYKGVPSGATEVTVYRMWNEETNNCEFTNFPDQADTYVFFGNATGTWYKLNPCTYSFPVSCVPAATFNTVC